MKLNKENKDMIDKYFEGKTPEELLSITTNKYNFEEINDEDVADLNHNIINSMITIQALTNNSKIKEECKKVIDNIRNFTNKIK